MVKFLPLLMLLNQHAPFSKKLSLLLMDKNCHYSVTSHARTPAHNRKVGGAEGSFHLQGRAADLLSSSKACKASLKRRALEHGFTVIEYRTHLHIDDRNEQLCLLKTRRGFKQCADQ
jgi:hypothetical protein